MKGQFRAKPSASLHEQAGAAHQGGGGDAAKQLARALKEWKPAKLPRVPAEELEEVIRVDDPDLRRFRTPITDEFLRTRVGQ